MSDLQKLFTAQDHVARWKAERENATARLELARVYEHCAYLISQHQPVAAMGLDRERLRLALDYVRHGDLNRLDKDFKDLCVAEIRKGVAA